MDQNPHAPLPNPVSLTHEEPNSSVQTTTTDKPRFNFKKYTNKKTLSIFAAIAILILASIFFLWPRAQVVSFASSTRESLSNSFTQLDSVDASLKSLFSFATQGEGDVQLTRLTNTFKKLLPILSTIAESDQKVEPDNKLGTHLKDLVKGLSGLFKNLEFSERGRVSFNGSIKGFTTPADDPNKIYRDQRDLATKVLTSIESSEEALETLEKQLGRESFLSSISSLKEELSDLKAKAEEYLSEAEKTADYYVLSSDLSIELEGSFDSFQISLESTNNVNSLVASFEEISKNLKKLKEELVLVKKEDLPAEIDNLHKDSIELFDVVIKYFDELKVLTLKEDRQGILDLTTETSIKLNQLILAGSDHEISFWKNNKSMNSYDSLSEDHTKALKKLEEARDKNKFFLLNLLGVK